MIRHILLIKFKASASIEKITELKDCFQSISLKIKGLQSLEWGKNNSPEGKNKEYTELVLINFIDQSARDNYLIDPEHMELKKLFRPLLDELIVFDYQV